MSEGQPVRELEYVVFYHAAPAVAVATGSFQRGIDPGLNVGAQYGRGFYTFRKQTEAERWGRLRAQWQGVPAQCVALACVVLDFRIPRTIWDGLRRHRVPDGDWGVPAAWLTEYDVLEGYFGPHGRAAPLEGAWQVKFNPHMYALSGAPVVWRIP